jgi:alginate O-acetyltransferase complex protein AlgI
VAFNQLGFICIFLPVSLILYRLIPEKAKKYLLIALSVVFVCMGNVTDMIYLAAAIIFNFFTAKQLDAFRKKGSNRLAAFVFVSGLCVDVLLLGYFKYYNFARQIIGLSPSSYGIAVPLGISFVTFSLITYLCDVYRGDEEVHGFIDFTLFVTFFPKITSGPIVSYRDFTKILESRRDSLRERNSGVERFILGLAKKVLIAGNLSLLFNAVSLSESRSALEAWLGALAYSFMLYFDFSGYSDMAIGIGKMLGYTLPENFLFPYISTGIGDFWRRWHSTLGAFFRNYVYIPLGGNRKGNARTAFNLFIVFALTGIWHGANYTFIVWGLYHFVLIAVERFVFGDRAKKIPAALRIVFTFFAVTIGWVFFFSDSITDAVKYLGNMVGIGCAQGHGVYYLTSFGALLLISAFLSLPVIRNALKMLDRKNPRFQSPVRAVLLAAVLVLCIAAIVSGTYSSFLYAAF